MDQPAPVSTEILRLKSENLQLKWIVAQMMQRWAKNDFALFLKVNKVSFGINITEDEDKIEIRIKRNTGASDTPGHVNIN